MKEKSYITKYLNNGNYCILTPIYYENEARPAWRKYFIGSRAECENMLPAAPEYLNATPEENATNRFYKRQEYLLLLDHGKHKQAAAIKAAYKF